MLPLGIARLNTRPLMADGERGSQAAKQGRTYLAMADAALKYPVLRQWKEYWQRKAQRSGYPGPAAQSAFARVGFAALNPTYKALQRRRLVGDEP